MSNNNPPSSSFPSSMGPGAQPARQGMDPASALRQIQEMRSQYQVKIEPTLLKVGYTLNGQDRRFTLPFDSIPLTGTSKWLLYGGSVRAMVSGTFLLDLMRGAENMVGRPLTQREAEGFAFHTGKRMRYSFLGSIVALGSGYGLAAYGYKTMKFPFRKPKPMEAYDVFPANRLPLITGQYARIAWQTTRANMYAALGLILVTPFFRSMGDSVMAVGLYRDERTKEVVKDMKTGFDRVGINRGKPGQVQNAPAPQTNSMEEQNSQDFYREDKAESQSFYGKSSDYSGDNSFSDSTTDTGAMSDSAMRSREARQSAPTSYGANRYTQRPDVNQQTSSSSNNSDFFFDDASPTAGYNPDRSASPQYQSSARSNSGSTWDRIRRGGPSQPTSSSSSNSESESTSAPPQQESRGWRSSRQQGQSQDFETKGDSFSFSNSDEQRALAKQQAQREFDLMLEKERNESGSGEYQSESYAASRGEGDGASGSGGGSAWDRRRRGGG